MTRHISKEGEDSIDTLVLAGNVSAFIIPAHVVETEQQPLFF